MSFLTPQPFLDWYGIWPGQTGIDERGQAWVQDMPVGVHLAVQPARKSEVFIVPERSWERGTLSPTCVLWEEGTLRLWYFSQGADEGDATFVAYAESRDGFDWQRPELGLQEYRGSSANNLLFRVDAFELQSVFIDPSPASPASPVRGIEGYGLEEADVLAGDEVSRVVTWKGRSDLSALEGQAVSVRLHLARAKVFSVAV